MLLISLTTIIGNNSIFTKNTYIIDFPSSKKILEMESQWLNSV